MRRKHKKGSFNLALLIIWIIIFAVISLKAPSFSSPTYVINVMLRNIVEIGMIALPMTMIIITGGIDLSVGNTMVFAAMMGGMAAASMGNVGGIIVTLLCGTLCGLLNGILIAKIKISPMVATLATMFLFLGLTRGISKGDSAYSYSFSEAMGTMSIAGIPAQILLYVLLAIIFYIVLSKTTFGRTLYAIGLNENAARYSGIKTERNKIILYTVIGLMCALAAFIWLGRFTSVKYDAGTSFNLKVITICVLGGTSINGGIGDMRGTILGTLIIATLNSGLTVMNISIDIQTIVQGMVLIIALISYAIINERNKKANLQKKAVSGNQAAASA